LTYGLSEKAKIRAREIKFLFDFNSTEKYASGITFKLEYEGSFVPVFLPNVIGYNSIYAALAGAAAGIAYGMNSVEISEALRSFDPPKGRMNLVKGIKGTVIIDDTYNSSPPSVASALEVIKIMPVGSENNKYAILGDMLELGSYSETGHKQTGGNVFAAGINYLVTVGERARAIGHGAGDAGMSTDNIFHFDDTATAGKFVQDRIKKGDIILVKGSQGMRMEKIVKEIMAEPMKAEEILVRMDKAWAKKKN
jgi:UDP-N-acetylmuramoyl-tripeptide--D-alanyl-D-alanine ligase